MLLAVINKQESEEKLSTLLFSPLNSALLTFN